MFNYGLIMFLEQGRHQLAGSHPHGSLFQEAGSASANAHADCGGDQVHKKAAETWFQCVDFIELQESDTMSEKKAPMKRGSIYVRFPMMHPLWN
jgi:hypothetical protein